MPFFAHTGSLGDRSDWQPLADHLQQVADRARELAESAAPNDLSLRDAAYVAGLLHDLGKYRSGFQSRLEHAFRNESCPVARWETYHKEAGAAKAAIAHNSPVAFAIAGHHGGIPNKECLVQSVTGVNGKPVADAVWPSFLGENASAKTLVLRGEKFADKLAAELFTRMIFSCLVDADWDDTSAHERQVLGLPLEPPAAAFQADVWLPHLLDFVREKAKTAGSPEVAHARGDVLTACLESAEQPPGVFSLTVPTGGGKTLSSLAFALRHADIHRMRRIIYVAPFLTILEQNAAVIRQALGVAGDDRSVLEHHSFAEPPGDEQQDETAREAAARRAENWDAPVVITTSVQFFESLFSNRPSRCRKLHNIARAVIILDECQSLPASLLAATCGMLRQLVDRFHSTIVLCTATQPALDHDELQENERLSAREITPAGLRLFERLERVEVVWPANRTETHSWQDIARRMFHETPVERPAALCVVNTRRAARDMLASLKEIVTEGVFHLSTGMCPAHRLETLRLVRERLAQRQPCYLISTQLIEAGVDVDFPLVFRELGPLESIIQAAGRCNREGALRDGQRPVRGRTVVFRSEASLAEPKKYYPPDAWYQRGRDTLEVNFLSAERPPRIDMPQDIRDYFDRLYHGGNLDPLRIVREREAFNFQHVAERYRLIKDDFVPVVIATWTPYQDQVETLLGEVRRDPSRAAFRRLAPFQVNLRRHELTQAGDLVAQVDERLSLLVWYGPYSMDMGMNIEATDMLLIV